MNRWVEWVEPFGTLQRTVHCRLKEEDAIAETKATALEKGHVYERDDMALEDFMSVHWAYFSSPEEQTNA